MDDDYLFNEKQSIRESARSLKKYGSTCNHVRNNEVLIRHEIEKTDTLQGIALKYGCTTEQLRRSNRLFASDSLFMRQYLMIPVEKGSQFYPKDDRPQSLPPRSLSIAETNGSCSNDCKSPQKNSSKSMDSIAAVLSPEEENKKSIDEFLGKIDSTIAELKKYVAKSQSNSSDYIGNPSDNELFSGSSTSTNSAGSSGYKKRTKNSSNCSISSVLVTGNNNNHHIRNSSSGSTHDTAVLLNITQGRQVQNSLQRLEREQDEFFEL